jgi:hypothetical protein
MTNNPVSQFEKSLRRAIRRKGNDDAIQEVVSHYQDLYQEALNKGLTIDEARRRADESIGNVAEIAKGIKAGNGKTKGAMLQWIAVAFLVFGAFLPKLMGYNGYMVGSLWGQLVEASDLLGLLSIYAAGFIAALGVFRARRVSIPAFCLAIALIPIGHSALLLSRSQSFDRFDAGWKRHADSWHQYAIKYRPVMKERYDLYEASIAGNQQASMDAIKRLSASVKRPQDRGAVFNESTSGKWIYPAGLQLIRGKLMEDNLNWIYFKATDSFETAQKAWRTSDVLLKSVPILRKGSEAEFQRTESMKTITAPISIRMYSMVDLLPFLYSFLASLLIIGITRAMTKLLPRERRAL